MKLRTRTSFHKLVPPHPSIKWRRLKMKVYPVEEPSTPRTSPRDPFVEYQRVYYIKEWKRDCGDYPIYKAEMVKCSKENINVQTVLEDDFETITKDEKRMWVITAQDFDREIKEFLVDWEDYKRIKYPKDRFNPSASIISLPKWKSNFSFASLISKYPRDNRQVVYLESEAALTTQMLHATKLLRRHQLHVPNVNPHFLQKISHRNPHAKSLATFYQRSLFEWMRDVPNPGEEFDVGADYCCTWNGNPLIKPELDMTLMFQKSILAKKDGILWITVSYRQKNNSIEKTKKDVCDSISWLAMYYGYNIQLIETGSYHGIVYFFFKT